MQAPTRDRDPPPLFSADRALARRMLWLAPRSTRMTDLWILALTLGLYAAGAGFVRLCERM